MTDCEDLLGCIDEVEYFSFQPREFAMKEIAKCRQSLGGARGGK
jgi:hypothetical protein